MVGIAIEFCVVQEKMGGTWVFEHPRDSRVWNLDIMKKLLNLATTKRVTFDMCAHGLMSEDREGPGLVYKPTTVLTNSSVVAEKVKGHCSKDNRHVHLVGGRAAGASAYPDHFCDRLVESALIHQAWKGPPAPAGCRLL